MMKRLVVSMKYLSNSLAFLKAWNHVGQKKLLDHFCGWQSNEHVANAIMINGGLLLPNVSSSDKNSRQLKINPSRPVHLRKLY